MGLTTLIINIRLLFYHYMIIFFNPVSVSAFHTPGHYIQKPGIYIRVCQNSKNFEDFIPKLGIHVNGYYKHPQKISNV